MCWWNPPPGRKSAWNPEIISAYTPPRPGLLGPGCVSHYVKSSKLNICFIFQFICFYSPPFSRFIVHWHATIDSYVALYFCSKSVQAPWPQRKNRRKSRRKFSSLQASADIRLCSASLGALCLFISRLSICTFEASSSELTWDVCVVFPSNVVFTCFRCVSISDIVGFRWSSGCTRYASINPEREKFVKNLKYLRWNQTE